MTLLAGIIVGVLLLAAIIFIWWWSGSGLITGICSDDEQMQDGKRQMGSPEKAKDS